MAALSMQRTASVARKELLHLMRDPATIFFALLIPLIELMMLGYAIDTNVRNVRTIIFDQDPGQKSRELIQKFSESGTFQVIGYAKSLDEFEKAIVSGRAKAGINIPHNFWKKMDDPKAMPGEKAQIQILVDGSESSVAGEVLAASNQIMLLEYLKIIPVNTSVPPVAEARVLFNPGTRSANFFIPGLMVVLSQMMAVMLTANAIVREKENGTMEQLFMTPVRPSELILGKLAPYLVLTFIEFCTIALLMRTIFTVPIHGSFFTLLALTFPFVLTMLGVGLWISEKASTRESAGQMAMGTVIPSIFLSGYVFPIDSMPTFFIYVSQVIPTTWLIDAVRGVILRGAGWPELWPHALVLWGMAGGVFLLSILKFHKRLT